MRETTPGRLAWKRFLSHRPALAGLVWIGVTTVLALGGYLIAPDDTPRANQMMLALETHPPGHCATLLITGLGSEKHLQQECSWLERWWQGCPAATEAQPVAKYELDGDSLHYRAYLGEEAAPSAWRSRHLLEILDPTLEREPLREQVALEYQPPHGYPQEQLSQAALQEWIKRHALVERTFWLGTDRFGRDILSRLVLGSRISLSIGLAAVLVSFLIGIAVGGLAGYSGGAVDQLLVWFINVFWSLPSLLLVLALSFALGEGLAPLYLAVGLSMWVEVARMVRGQVMALKQEVYIEAGKVLGYSGPRLLFRHLLPNMTGPLLVVAASNFATAILLEAGLSFLGMGVPPPTPTWGYMIKDHYGYLVAGDVHLALAPGLAIVLLVLSFYLVGNGLRDAFDYRSD
jgi:peptide/nickel transport system permease protein